MSLSMGMLFKRGWWDRPGNMAGRHSGRLMAESGMPDAPGRAHGAIVRVRAGKTAWRRFYDRGSLFMAQTRILGRTTKRICMDNRFQ